MLMKRGARMRDKKVQRIIEVAGIFGCALLVVLLVFLEGQILTQFMYPVDEEMLVDDWVRDVFNLWAFIGVGCSFVMIVLWYFWNSRFATFKKWQDLARRISWWILFGILFGVLLLSWFMIYGTVVENIYLVYIVYAINSLGLYYFATALFSPVAIKYIPPGSKYLRRW
jgi:hypothetical protein